MFEAAVSERTRLSDIGSGIDGLRGDDLAGLPDALLEEDLDQLQRACERLETERLRRLAEFDRRAMYERDGHLSCAAWLASKHRLSWREAHEQVRLARALAAMPATRQAVEEGEVSLSAAAVLAHAWADEREAFERSQELLLQAARSHTVRELKTVTAFWRERVSQDRGDEERFAQSYLHASATFGGMVRVDGSLDPVAGAGLLTALGAVMDAEARSASDEDSRSPAQRRADALGEICRQWLDGADRPTVAGERPHVTVTIGLAELRGVAGTPVAVQAPDAAPALGAAGPVGVQTALELACDANVRRVVLSPTSEPLDVGRRTKVVPPALRHAVMVRDRGCRFPDCGRPQAWCDAHHVRHWARGGETALSNLVLLCRRHHRLIHSERFGLQMAAEGAVFTRPDGSVLGDRGPPGRDP